MKNIIFYIIAFFSTSGYAQESLSEVLAKYNNESIPYIYSKELSKEIDITILDAREKSEYDVSHLKDAIYVGYKKFNLENAANQLHNKNQKIVVYCSLGVRSEDIAEKLKNAGFTNVLNLYGGIFEWKNNNFKVFNSEEKETEKVHAYSKAWSKWLTKGLKIYEK